MNLAYLVQLNLLVIYFISRYYSKQCIECNYFILFLIIIVLIMYDSYMSLGNKSLNKETV